ADRVDVTALEGDGERFVILHCSGSQTPGTEQGQRLPIKNSMVGEVTRTHEISLLHADDRAQVHRDYPSLAPLYDAGMRSFLAIPLSVGGRSVGALHFFSETPHEYTPRHVLLAESVAGQIAGVIANALLRTAEIRAAHENAILAEIGRIISSSLDIRAVYEGFARRVNEVVPCERLVVTTLDLERETATDIYVYGIDVPGWSEGTVHDIKGTPFEEVVRTRQFQYRNDVTTDMNDDESAREAIQAAGLRSTLMAPLISNGDVIGTINLKCAAPGVYTRRHGELAQRIANQIAGAIANARLYGDLKRVADERRTLATIALAANKDLDLDGVFARAADALRDIVAYDRMSITLFDADDAVLRVAFERGKRHEDFRSGAVVTPAKGDPFVGGAWVWQSGHDTSLHPDGRLRAAVTVPLGSRDRHLGYIRLRSDTGDAYDERSTEMLERVAHSLTPAIQNALEHRQAMRLAQERERSLVLDHENRELQRTNEANSRFLSTVSHELKTPLTSITAFTDILLKNRRGGMTETDLSQLTVIQRNNRRLGNLIGDLLDLSQIDRGGMKLNMTEFDVGELITEVVEGFRPIADAKSQPIVHSAPGRPVRLRADRNRLMQVLTNLLSNASKYSPRDALITVLARRWKNRLYFTTIDCGIGISEEDHKSLFTLFFRADNVNTRAESGTGVGLHIAQTIVELHGGEITVTSSVGEGTTVSFYVPGAFSGTGNTDQGRAAEASIIPWSRLDDLPEPQQAAS
ncbi:MAG: GAF domain-containing protein, partial [Chloroflexi bacterium]|nr:GAF domain-containing protein [Chloroflexota bacterium]